MGPSPISDRYPMATASDSTPRSEQAYQRLLEAIRSGQLQPGRRIRETEIAAWLGISRTPIREAIRRLESEGLILSSPNKGMAVAKLDYQAVIELYQMREGLEGTAAALAARQASDAEILAMKALFEAEQRLIESPMEQALKNKAFHNALYHAAHNRYLLKALAGLQDAMTLLGPSTYRVPARNAQALAEHRELLEAIEARDPALAEQRARQHIRSALGARIQLINEQFQEGLLRPEAEPAGATPPESLN